MKVRPYRDTIQEARFQPESPAGSSAGPLLGVRPRVGSGRARWTRKDEVMSLRIKKILVPIDFSEVSSLALRYGASFAREYEAELMVLTVAEDDSEWVVDLSDRVHVKDRWREERIKEGGRLIDAFCGDHLQEQPYRKAVRIGEPSDEIVSCCTQETTDLLIIGSHGRSGVVNEWLGGVAYSVSKRAPCPVLMVKPNEHEFA